MFPASTTAFEGWAAWNVLSSRTIRMTSDTYGIIIWIHPIIELSSISLSSAALAAFHQQWDEWHRPAAERDLCTLAECPAAWIACTTLHCVNHAAAQDRPRWSKMVKPCQAKLSHSSKDVAVRSRAAPACIRKAVRSRKCWNQSWPVETDMESARKRHGQHLLIHGNGRSWFLLCSMTSEHLTTTHARDNHCENPQKRSGAGIQESLKLPVHPGGLNPSSTWRYLFLVSFTTIAKQATRAKPMIPQTKVARASLLAVAHQWPINARWNLLPGS